MPYSEFLEWFTAYQHGVFDSSIFRTGFGLIASILSKALFNTSKEIEDFFPDPFVQKAQVKEPTWQDRQAMWASFMPSSAWGKLEDGRGSSDKKPASQTSG